MLKNSKILKNVKKMKKEFHKCSTTFQQIYFSKNVQQLKFNKCFRCNSACAAEFNKCSTNVQQLKFNKSSTNVFLMVLGFFVWFLVFSCGFVFFLMVLGFFLWFCVFSYGFGFFLMVLGFFLWLAPDRRAKSTRGLAIASLWTAFGPLPGTGAP